MAKKNLLTMTTAALMQLVRVFLYLVPLLTAVLIMNYLGYNYMNDNVELNPEDWRRKSLILMSWLIVITMALNLLFGFGKKK